MIYPIEEKEADRLWTDWRRRQKSQKEKAVGDEPGGYADGGAAVDTAPIMVEDEPGTTSRADVTERGGAAGAEGDGNEG